METEKPSCKHLRGRLVAKDDNEEYIECLDCGAIFETTDQEQATGFDESLSDA